MLQVLHMGLYLRPLTGNLPQNAQRRPVRVEQQLITVIDKESEAKQRLIRQPLDDEAWDVVKPLPPDC